MKGTIRKILLEFGDDSTDEDIDKFGELFPENVYNRLFKIFDSDPEKFMRYTLKDLSLNSTEKEFNIIYKYLTEYKNRTPYYIPVVYTANEISEFFNDGEYGIQTIVKNFLGGDWDYGYDYECFDVDDWLIDKIDQNNMKILKEKYLENLDGEENEEDFKEFIESEYGSDIGCAAGDAQHSADINSLHSDILDEINDYLSRFNGKLTNKVDNQGKVFDELQYEGVIELGELTDNSYFDEVVIDELESSYPSPEEILWKIAEQENYYGGADNPILPDEKIRINEDRHFRYGGNGDIDWDQFNETLLDKLSY
jgi:hypothetical protein